MRTEANERFRQVQKREDARKSQRQDKPPPLSTKITEANAAEETQRTSTAWAISITTPPVDPTEVQEISIVERLWCKLQQLGRQAMLGSTRVAVALWPWVLAVCCAVSAWLAVFQASFARENWRCAAVGTTLEIFFLLEGAVRGVDMMKQGQWRR